MRMFLTIAFLGLAACSTSHEASPARTEACKAQPAQDLTLEAATVCLPRNCGTRPICTANSRAVCSPETDCRWKCVPLTGPI